LIDLGVLEFDESFIVYVQQLCTTYRLVKLTFGVELIPTETILRYNER